MHDELLNKLNLDLEPFIMQSELSEFDDSLKTILNENKIVKKAYNNIVECTECHETCSLEVFSVKEKLYVQCPAGYIVKPKEIFDDDITGYSFITVNLLKTISIFNSIDFEIVKINNNCLYFGKKQVGRDLYKHFYIKSVNLSNFHQAIHQVKEHYSGYEKAVIILPKVFSLNNNDKIFMEKNNCRIIFLEDLFINDLVIKQSQYSSIINNEDAFNFEIVIDKRKNQFIILDLPVKLTNKQIERILRLFENNKQIVSYKEFAGYESYDFEYNSTKKTAQQVKIKVIDRIKKAFKNADRLDELLNHYGESLELLISNVEGEGYYLNLEKEKFRITY